MKYNLLHLYDINAREWVLCSAFLKNNEKAAVKAGLCSVQARQFTRDEVQKILSLPWDPYLKIVVCMLYGVYVGFRAQDYPKLLYSKMKLLHCMCFCVM